MKQGTKELTDGNMKLRQYTEADIPVLYEKQGCDPEMMHYTGWNPYATLDMTRGFISRIIEGYDQGADDYSWFIEVAGKSIGTIGAYDYDPEQSSIEIGYSIFRENWGNGFASQALDMVCDYLMREEGICTLKAWSAEDNVTSKRVLEKAGFHQTETKEAAINVDGVKFDQVFYEKRK